MNMTLTPARPSTEASDAIPHPPGMPRMIHRADGVIAPAAPRTFDETGLDAWILSDLTLKLLNTVPYLSTAAAADKLRLPAALVEKILWQLKEDQMVEILGQVDEVSYRYAITNRGREHAKRCMEVSGYVGAAPVSLHAYTTMIEWQTARRTPPTFDRIRDTITAQLVLSDQAIQVAVMASSSGRSLFVSGPAGNGKTSLGRVLHACSDGDLWIPYCFTIDGTIIRIFDKQLHHPLDDGAAGGASSIFSGGEDTDRRWVRIKPPFVVAGGEMTIAELDLSYSPSHRFYEAPPHVKANGGTFLIDDFGRQRIEPHQLLNRWIIPLEQRIDHLTLHTGQKMEVPFRLMLVVATNLPLEQVSDPAFLRRMGYRMTLEKPTPERWADVFRRYAAQAGAEVPPGVVEALLARYTAESRELRSSEPRDLIERCRDLCRLHRKPFALTPAFLDAAWCAYFGVTERISRTA